MNNCKKIISIFVLTTALVGCKGIAMPTDTIKAPSSAVININDNEINKAIKENLSEDIKIMPPKNALNEKAIVQKDLDGDGKNELIVTIQSKANSYTGGILVLKQEKGRWNKLLYTYGEGKVTAQIDFTDIDGDGKDEILISNFIGGSAGNGLSIYKCDKDKLNLIAKAYYKKMFIEDMTDANGKKDGKFEIALWLKDTGDLYYVEVFRYESGKLTAAKDVYPYYFKTVEEYYKTKLEGEFKGSAALCYHYTDALVKAGKAKEALGYIEKFNFDLYKKTPYEIGIRAIKAEAFNSLKEYKKAIEICNDLLKANEKSGKLNDIDAYKVYNALYNAYTGLSDKEKAKEFYEKVVNIDDFFIEKD